MRCLARARDPRTLQRRVRQIGILGATAIATLLQQTLCYCNRAWKKVHWEKHGRAHQSLWLFWIRSTPAFVEFLGTASFCYL